MKTYVMLFLYFIASMAWATMTAPIERGTGMIAGKMAIYASGDTIAFVCNDNSTANPATISSLVYKYSYNGGTTWYSTVIDQIWDGFCHPTLSVNPGEILVTFVQAYQRKLARSTNGGMTWAITNLGKTFEKAPRIEKRNGRYYNFEIDQPYPEHLQRSFLTIDNPEELRAPVYITEEELSWNGTPVYFHGRDIVYGALRSNSNIWIKRTNVGTNNGWPSFLDPVITSGTISCAETYPASTIFRGGLVTGAPPIQLVSEHPDYQQGTLVGPADPGHIVLVTGMGSTYSVKIGTRTNYDGQFITAFENYPQTNNYVGLNIFTVFDTVWVDAPSGVGGDGRFYTNSQLWIRGVFSGHQTWSCSDTIMIVGDITLSGTTPGTAPDNPANPNLLDSVTLITSKNVILKYGFKDPNTGQRVHPLCKSDANLSYIYATIYAMNEDPDPRKDGTFTFEYQHPHPAIPDMTYNGTLYTNIDLHRYLFSSPIAPNWPEDIDLPWYNPLWPEFTPYLERGIIQVWGSINQRRRGYVHRSWVDSEYQTGGAWDLTNDACGGASFVNGLPYFDETLQITTSPVNYPGTAGAGIGYKKDYRGDKRHEIDERLYYWGLKLGSRQVSSGDFTNSFELKYAKRIHSKNYARRSSAALYCVNDVAVFEYGTTYRSLRELTEGDGLITGAEMTLVSQPFIAQTMPSGTGYSLKLKTIIPSTQTITQENDYTVDSMVNDIVVLQDGRKVLARLNFAATNYLSFHDILANGELSLIENVPVSILPTDELTKASRIWLVPSAANELEIVIWKKLAGGEEDNPFGRFYTAHAVLPAVDADDPVAPVIPAMALFCAPNPMRNEMKLTLELDEEKEFELRIYNLRGQLVRTHTGISDKGAKAEWLWDGKDSGGRDCGSGVFVIKVRAKGYPDLSRSICRL